MLEFMVKTPQTLLEPRTPAILYCDESGNTGSNLNDPDQPFYVLAGLVVPEGAAPAVEDLVNRLRREAAIRSPEVKAAALMNSSRGRQAIGRFLTDVFEVHTALFVGVYEKRFGICARIVDDCFDGACNSRVDIRLKGDPLGKQRIANRLYRALGDESLRKWAGAWRKGDRDSLVAGTKGLSAALRKVRKKDLAFKIDGSLENIDEWLPKPSALESINLPVWIATFMQVEYFCEATGLGPVEIVHDEITQFDAAYQEELAIFQRGTRYVRVGPHGTPFVSGLRRLTTYRSASSKSSLVLQAADVIASATCLFLKRTAKHTSLYRSLEPIDTFLRRLSFISTLVTGVKHIDWMIAEPTLAHLANLPRAGRVPR